MGGVLREGALNRQRPPCNPISRRDGGPAVQFAKVAAVGGGCHGGVEPQGGARVCEVKVGVVAEPGVRRSELKQSVGGGVAARVIGPHHRQRSFDYAVHQPQRCKLRGSLPDR